MLKRLLALAAIGTGLGYTSMAIAEPLQRGLFFGGNVGYVQDHSDVAPEALDDDLDFSSFELNIGYKYNNLLGLDIRFGGGLTEREFDITGSTNSAEMGIDSISAFYYRPEFTNEDARLYILIGQSSVDVTYLQLDANGNAIGQQSTGSFSGLSYGLGAGWYYDDNVTINLEYRMLIDDDEAELSTINLGFDYRLDLDFLKF